MGGGGGVNFVIQEISTSIPERVRRHTHMRRNFLVIG